jgi:DnaJ-class molecular chaperone
VNGSIFDNCATYIKEDYIDLDLKTEKKKDYYSILDIPKTASSDEIRKAYKKLALQYHPDRNPGNKEECEEKFKLISEAYTVLSNDDKRRNYDMMGGECSFDDMMDGDLNDPFSVFNDIFQQHMNQFMNMQYEDDINVGDIFSNMSGGKTFPFGNVHVRVHTFSNDPSVFQSIHNQRSFQDEYEDENEEEEEERSPFKNIGSNISSLFSNLFKKKETPVKSAKQNKDVEIPQKVKIIYNKPEAIVYNITVSLSDVFNFKKKKVTIVRKRKTKKGRYIEKEKKIMIPLYAKELLLEKEGNDVADFKERGDVIIHISYKPHKNCIRVNDYDVLIKKDITISEIYHPYQYQLALPNGNILHVEGESLIKNKDLLQKISGKGIPYENDEKVEYGTLFILYQIKFHDSLCLDKTN